MTTCAVCEEEIVLEADEEPTMASCGLHEVHSYCDVDGVGCLICNPAPPLPVTTPTPQVTDDGVPDEDGDVFYDAEEGTPEDWPGPDVPVAPTEPVADPTVGGTAPTDEPDAEATAHADAAGRIAGDVARAQSARESAATTIAGLVALGVAEETVLGVMDELVPGFSTSYEVCAADELVGYEAMASWPANADTTKYVNDTCDSYVGHAGVLQGAEATLSGIRVVGIGTGFRQRLTATGAQNVADMALGGEDYTGHNLHDLTDNLKGWASIRAEVGKIILVRWADTNWEVGATGAHTNDNDYKLDATIATTFVSTLAYRLDGVPTLG